MSATTEAARKSAIVAKQTLESRSTLKQTPQKASKHTPQNCKTRRTELSNTIRQTDIEKLLVKKASKRSTAMKINTAPDFCTMPPVMQRPTTRQQGGLDIFPKKRNVLQPKKTGLAEENEHRNAMLFGRGSQYGISTKRLTVLNKQSIVLEDATLKRIKNNATNTLKERCRLAELGLKESMPLLKNSESIETAIAVLEQQIDDYRLDIRKLKFFGCGSQRNDVTDAGYQALLALASWGSDVGKTSERSGSAARTKGTESVKMRNLAREKAAHHQSSKMILVATCDNNIRTKKDSYLLGNTDASEVDTGLEVEPFGPSPDKVSKPAPANLQTRLTPSSHPSFSPASPRSSKSSISKTHRPSIGFIAHRPQKMSIVDPIKDDTLQTADDLEATKFPREGIDREESHNAQIRFVRKKDDDVVGAVGCIAKSRLHANSNGDLKFRKKAVGIDQCEKRKRGLAEETSHKRVISEGRQFTPFRARGAVPVKNAVHMYMRAELSCVDLGFSN